MKRLVVIGAGTAGTMIVNKLSRELDDDWSITVVDRDDEHQYQPGFLFIPFGDYKPADVVRSRHAQIDDRATMVLESVDRVDADANSVVLMDGRTLEYDYLVIASGTHPNPAETPGLLGDEWRKSIFDFYTLEGATALHEALEDFTRGRLVVNIMETPIKCPVAPLEFAFLADSFFRQRGIRDQVELVYATPMPAVFTKPIAAERLGHLLDDRDIKVETDFYVERVEGTSLVSYDEREVDFDLLVTVPVNSGAEFVARSGLGDELNHVAVDKHTFLSKAHRNIFAIGDAADLPTSKAGSVAHFSVDVFVPNFIDYVAGRPMTEAFDGHANCFVESGDGKALLIDFNYDTEPLPGSYPVPGIGPFRLLTETVVNHIGKKAFKWTYWNVLLPGRPLPVPNRMSMAGKIQTNQGDDKT
ncbi:MAG: NAD(P)/FAD-dependent oxidoreductase [Acidimicrobiia bacterium]|nr:NAD(P)/FAD-dependent oxidoreductase [Acidimicrobiia bacterium]